MHDAVSIAAAHAGGRGTAGEAVATGKGVPVANRDLCEFV